MSFSTRKYLTEFALNIYSSEPVMLSPADLDNLANESEEAKSQLKNSNVYLILKRPRISFISDTLTIKDREVIGDLAVQLEDKTMTFPFRLDGKLPEEITSAVSLKYPYTKLTLQNHNGEISATYPIAFLIRNLQTELKGLDDLEVVYAGQAFGAAGERSTIERLSSHSTLQKIQADISANEPYMEVFLALYSFDFHRFLLSMDGSTAVRIDGDADQQHYQQALQSDFKRSMRISLAEAALIRYFEPKYNKIYKTGFPHKRHKILQKLFEFDFAGLVVEASVEDHGIRLYSQKRQPNFHHIMQFDLHDKTVRRSFFFEEP